MKLTEHFNVEEFTRSDVASRYRIDNSLSPDNPNHAAIICNLLALCENVLEPLRQWYDKPITISSGYRCRELNSHPAIGGSSSSQHMTGEAADLHIPDTATGIRWFAWIRDNCDYDQLICERVTPHASTFWIHVSYSRTRNRKQVITDMIKRQLPNLV